MRDLRWLAGPAWAALVALGAPAQAQDAAPSAAGEVIYEAEFFAQYRPRTALDMIARVPGFTLDEGEERRGFTGAQSNVLIDGEPPASKAQEIDDVLARIPAGDVVRIVLVRGGTSAGSAQGVRANVVRRPSSGDGVWAFGLERAEDDRFSPEGEAAWSGRRGQVEFGVSAALDVAHFPLRGERRDSDASGDLVERRVERIPTEEREARAAAEAAFPAFGGALSLNAQINRVEFSERLESRVFDATGAAAGSSDGDFEESEDVGEFGAAFRRSLGVWRTELGAVATRRTYDSEERSTDRDAAGALEEDARQTQSIESGETIVRAAARRDLRAGWRLEFGVEGALNTLEQRLTLTEDNGGGPVPVILPSANVRVEERRVEASFLAAGRVAPRWTLEAGAAVEASRLTQSGDADQEAELVFWKPSVQLVRALGARNQMRVRLYRDVGQLDFEDFVSAADINAAIVDAGNPDLRPETSWRIEAAGDWRFGDDGAFSVTVFHWAIEDTLDIAPVGPPGDLFDAPANIGDATADGVRVSLALPLAFPPDAELRLDASAQRANVRDPLTGEERTISELEESTLSAEFRQDLDSLGLAWGVEFEREIEAPSYRLDQVERERDAESLMVWVETSALGAIKLRAWGANLSASEETRARRFFDPDRRGAFDGADARARGAGLSFGLAASGRF